MLERILFNAESKGQYLRAFIEVFFIVVIAALFNVFMGGNGLFLVAIVALFLAYPISKYIRTRDFTEITKGFSERSLIRRHDVELFMFWLIFVACVVGFFVVSPLITDYSAQAKSIPVVTGNITYDSLPFFDILLNNLGVLLLTALISFVSISGLVLVLVWNASLLAYVLYQTTSYGSAAFLALGYIGHGLIEVAGYVFIGIAASIVSFRFEHMKDVKHARSIIIKDVLVLTLISVCCIVLAAGLEVL